MDQGLRGVEAANPHIDRVATLLIAATAATSSMLTLFGMNNERVWVLLDNNTSRWLLICTGLAALLAVGSALFSYVVTDQRSKSALVAMGALFYISSLLAAVFAAALSANVHGRASIVDMSVTRSASGAVAAFRVTGTSIDEDERLGVRLIDEETGDVLAQSYPRATSGVVRLHVTVPIPQPSPRLLLQAWTIESPHQKPVCAHDVSRGSESADGVVADCLEVG
ncbi:MAG TPA: hypothetical protein VFL69_14090 [Marmoricola sp.]|nr:hypothetical protein [Marmoricola sp.]